MSDAIKVAIITGGLSILGIIITAVFQYFSTQNKIKEEFSKQTAEIHKQNAVYQAVTNEKIDELSRRVEKHNNLVERTYRLEENSAVMAEKMRNFDDRIDDLEKAGA